MQVSGTEPVSGTSLEATGIGYADLTPRDRLRQAVARWDEAEAKGDAVALVEALTTVANCYKGLSSHATAEEFFRQALRAARCTGSLQMQVMVLIQLAQTAGLRARELIEHDLSVARASRERARDSAFEASILIHKAPDAPWAAQALMAVSEVLVVCGDHDDACGMRARAERWLMA